MTQLSISVSPNTQTITRALEATPAQLQLAATRALNKTARWLRTQIIKETSQALKIKQSLVRPTLALVRAKRGRVQATVGQKKRMGSLNAIQLGQARQQASGVRVARRHYDDAFISTMPNGSTGIFKRKPNVPRLPIIPVRIVMTGTMAEAMEKLAETPTRNPFHKIFERELNFILRSAQ